MQTEDFKAFTRELLTSMENDPNVTGLVVLDDKPEPDQWSRHNIIVITQTGKQESYRTRLDWLPRHAQISLHFQDSAQGLKVFYADGHLADITIYDKSELFLAQVSRYRILMDRSGHLKGELEQISQMTALRAQTNQAPLEIMWGRFLFTLVSALRLWQRGERLASHHMFFHEGLGILLRIFSLVETDIKPESIDQSDIFRYWEKASPVWSTFLHKILEQPVPTAASLLWNQLQQDTVSRLPEICQRWGAWLDQQKSGLEMQ